MHRPCKGGRSGLLLGSFYVRIAASAIPAGLSLIVVLKPRGRSVLLLSYNREIDLFSMFADRRHDLKRQG